MAVAEIVVVPLGTGSPSISEYVAQCLEILVKNERIKYQLTPMGTIVEGEVSDILRLVQEMHEVPFQKGALRVSTSLRLDERRDKELSMEGKVKSVLEKI
ncbi:MAG: hypothetical protein JG781_568 [Peptococcaceae bacterium]|jgi:uncharacterized protein (TIGR00106 family)|nr:hypothetical protein [Peptococcaceae bacterium]